MKINNPVIPGFNPDPTVCRHNGYYYIVTSSFEYFPGLPIYRSKDLANWDLIGYAMNRPEQLDLRECRWSHGVWAPCLRKIGAQFVIAATLVGKDEMPEKFRNFFITADDPEADWSNPRWIDIGGIDPEIVQMPDGDVYYLRNGSDQTGSGVVGAPFDMQKGQVTEALRLLWCGSGYGWPEGPHLYYIDGKYYLQIAEGGTGAGHSVVIARSDHPMGAYEGCPHNPVLSNRGRDNSIQACGHADMIQHTDGSWWAVHLGIRDYNALSALGRESFLVPVQWQDGWPVFGNGGICESVIDVPHLLKAGRTKESWCDDFRDPVGSLHWNTRRNLPSGTLLRGGGKLILRPSMQSIDKTLDCPAWYGVRQRHYEVEWKCYVMIPPAASCCGFSVWMNENWRYDIRLIQCEEGCLVGLWSVLGAMRAQLSAIMVKKADIPLQLICRADRTGYEFFVSKKGDELHHLGRCEAACISSIVSGGFTGAFFALWADGEGREYEEGWEVCFASYAVDDPIYIEQAKTPTDLYSA